MKGGSKGYAGKIQNTGTQIVKAPAQSTKSGKGKVKTGNDLRNGSGK